MAKKIDVERCRELIAAVDALQATLNRLRAATVAMCEELGVTVEASDMGRLTRCLFLKLLKPAPGNRVSLAALRLSYIHTLGQDASLRAAARECGYTGTNRDPVWKALRLLAMERADRVINLQGRIFLEGFALKDDASINEIDND